MCYPQTYADYEIIIVNDNPEDKHQIDKLLDKYVNLIILHHKIQEGANSARNLGILNSSGDIIAFLDDDDTCLEKSIFFLKIA